MIWTKELAVAAAAIAHETGPPWYAPHVEAVLKTYAKTLATYPPGEKLGALERQGLHELRMWLDPYSVRPSHAAFRQAYEAALDLAAA
jgi:hypothetical protein